jgi:uncharacterized protein (TIGR03067 family)
VNQFLGLFWLNFIGDCMITRYSLLFSLLVATFASAVDPKETKLQQEETLHQGVWQVTSFTRNGKETAKQTVDSIERMVDGKHVVWKRELNPEINPKTLDVSPDGGTMKGEKLLGIYKLEGDILTICMAPKGKDRPAKFEAIPGTDDTLMVFKKKTKPQN